MKQLLISMAVTAFLLAAAVCGANPTSFGVFAGDGKTALLRVPWVQRCLDQYSMMCNMKRLNCCQGGVELNAPARAPTLSSAEVLVYLSDTSIVDGFQLWGPLSPHQACIDTGDNGRVCTPKLLGGDKQHDVAVEPKGNMLFRFSWTERLKPGVYNFFNSKNSQPYLFKVVE